MFLENIELEKLVVEIKRMVSGVGVNG